VDDPRQYVRTVNLIRARIEDGTYKPHELLPSIRELADETGFSRHTIGKALRLLQREGLVDRIPGLGYSAGARAVMASGRPDPHPLTTVNGDSASRRWGKAGEGA
jgi:DNA-binding transcriptional MocR family regulator